MNVAFHPILAFSVVGLPLVLYSVLRTGYSFDHLVDVRLLKTLYAFPIGLLACMLVGVTVLYTKGNRRLPPAVALVSAVVFICSQFFVEFPLDYKLWIYIVAPTFVWCVLCSLPFATVFSRCASGKIAEQDA